MADEKKVPPTGDEPQPATSGPRDLTSPTEQAAPNPPAQPRTPEHVAPAAGTGASRPDPNTIVGPNTPPRNDATADAAAAETGAPKPTAAAAAAQKPSAAATGHAPAKPAAPKPPPP